MDASQSASYIQQSPDVISITTAFIGIVLSAFLGALFSGIVNNFFESRRRARDKRSDKYFEHRNSIVQIEHELIPLRLNTSRNIAALSDAIENTNPYNIRFILRFYKLSLSSGLSQKLVSLAFINKYAKLHSDIEIFNSDLEYVSGLVQMVIQNSKKGKVDKSINTAYKQFLPHLQQECEDIDQKTLELLTISKLALRNDDTRVKEQYIKDGKEIKYKFDKKSFKARQQDIEKEEDFSNHPDEKRPQFISPFLDLKRVTISNAPRP